MKQTDPSSNQSLRSVLFPPLFLLSLGCIAYANSFYVPFQFDDNRNIVANPLIQSFEYFLNPSRAESFPGYRDFVMRFVGFFTFAVNYSIHGLHTWGYHLLNLLIHLANAWLVYSIIILTGRTPFFQNEPDPGRKTQKSYFKSIALLSAGLFVSHPIQTQAVTYIVQRFASLATLFYLLTLFLFIRWQLSSRRKFFYIGSLLCSLLALKTKEIAFTIPLALWVYDCCFFHSSRSRRLYALLPFALACLIVPLSYLATSGSDSGFFQQAASESKVLTDMPRSTYLFTELRVIVTYIRLLFVPIHQNFDYDFPLYSSLLNLPVLLSVCFLTALLALGILFIRRSNTGDARLRLISFGIFWFFLTLLSESGLIPIVDVIYEHRLYLPSMGAFLSIVTALFWGMERLSKNPVRAFSYSTILLYAIVAVLAFATLQRNRVWYSELSLWENAYRFSPNKIRVLTNLGSAYLESGNTDAALDLFQKAEALDPGNDVVYTNIATVLYRRSFIFRDNGMFEKAADSLDRSIAYYRKALELKPNEAYIQKFLEGALQERSRYIIKNKNE